MDSLRLIQQSLTGGVADWLVRLADSTPGTVDSRPDPPADAPAAAVALRRLVREVVTMDPAMHQPLSNIQIMLIEYALECVEWEALARHPRLRRLDWTYATATQT